jgi:hypothetical protein
MFATKRSMGTPAREADSLKGVSAAAYAGVASTHRVQRREFFIELLPPPSAWGDECDIDKAPNCRFPCDALIVLTTCIYGGEGEIRTHEPRKEPPVFKSDDHHVTGTHTHISARIACPEKTRKAREFSVFRVLLQNLVRGVRPRHSAKAQRTTPCHHS